MTTRKRLLAYHAIGLGSVCATFIALKSAAAPTAVGFTAVYLAILTVAYFVGWLLDVRSKPARFAAMAVMVLFNMVLLTTMGGPSAGIAAIVLSLVSYWPRQYAGSTLRRSPAVA